MVLATTSRRFRAFKHLFFRYCKWGKNESYLSKIAGAFVDCEVLVSVGLTTNR